VPGILAQGRWGRYKGEIVSDAYVANNVFAQAAAKNGMSLQEALETAQNVAKLISGKKLKIEPDQPKNQATNALYQLI
jgi:hypothetical protein